MFRFGMLSAPWPVMAGVVFRPDDGTGADTTTSEDKTSDTAADTTQQDDADKSKEADASDGGSKAWWEADTFKDQRDWLTAKGLLIDDRDQVLTKAIKAHQEAEQRLGKPADQILDKPKEGQSVADWMRQNTEVFGIPDAPDKYELPEIEMPEGVIWDKDFEDVARKIAHEEGVPQAALVRFVEAYGDKVKGLLSDATANLETAKSDAMAKVRADWGAETPAKIAAAQRAASVIAEKAGVSAEGVQNMAAVLTAKTGDADVLRMFAAIGEMLGEDALVLGDTTSQIGMTPVEAKAELAKMNAPDGEYGKAYAAGDKRAMAALKDKRTRLYKIAGGAA